MKQNRSLAISSKIQELKMGNIISLLYQEFPTSIFDRSYSDETKTRDRVFTVNNTLLTMVLTATQQDKTLKNSVSLYYTIHQQNKINIVEEQEKQIAEEIEQAAQADKRKVGRPKKHTVKLPKSLTKDISLNTSAYSKARNRVPLQLANDLFLASRIQKAKNVYTHWHGYHVLLGDGTYVQMQDTESIRKEYEVKHKGKSSKT